MPRKLPKGKSLAELYPNLVEEWHPIKNGDFSPFDVSFKSNIKVWWKCNKGDDHIWESSIYNRTIKSSKCLICSNRKAVHSNCLATINPKIAKEWHPTKNGNLTPKDVVAGGKRKIWWKCPKGIDHEWESTIENRIKHPKCSICDGKTIVHSNCLSTTNPSIAKLWHPTKNKITPFDVSAHSNKKVWWKCDKGKDHEWEAGVRSISSGTRCPVCSNNKIVKSNSLLTTHPELAKEWHRTKNKNSSPELVGAGSNSKFWWKCDKGDDHVWLASCVNRTSHKSGCPVCTSQKITHSNCLATLKPNIAKLWHPTRNKITPFDVSPYANKKVWWKCPKGIDHEWESMISSVSSGTRCPICANLKLVSSNSLLNTHPEIAKLWHPTKNGLKTPNDTVAGSSKKFWWKCDKADDHEWQATGNSMVFSLNSGCPMCSGKILVKSNCLKNTHPEIAKEWHPTKNGILTPRDVFAGTGKSYWWKCDKGVDHEWKAKSNNRLKGTGCPYCTLTPQSKQELTITFELIQFFKDINPKGFKTRVDGKLWTVDIYIPKLNLAIEFDGSYWHKDKRALDKLKTKQLKKEGFDIIRVRETPLKKINRTDVISKQPFNGKEVANKVLKQIMKMYDLDDRKVLKIENYLYKKELQNEKGLDKYINMILSKKAEKKNT